MIRIKGKHYYSELIIAYLLFFPSFNYYIQTILGSFGYNGKIVPGILYGIGAILGIISYIRMSNRAIGLSLTVIFIFGTILFQINHPEDYSLIHTSYTDIAYSPDILLFLFALPLVFWNLKRIDYSLFLRICHFLSRSCLILFLLAYATYLKNPVGLTLEYMTFSYNALPAICFCISIPSFGKGRVFDIIISVISIAAVFISGSRGCSVCILTFIFLYAFFIKKISRSILILIVIAFFCVLFIDFNGLLINLSGNLESSGIHSRTISRILDESFATSVDRDYLKEQVASAINDSPIVGHGLWGDRAIIHGFVHNIAYEMVCSFGYFIGGSILIWLFCKTFLCLLSSIPLTHKILLCATIPYGLIQLFFSGSFLNDPWFFFLIAQLISNSTSHKMNKYETSRIITQ